MRLTLPLTALIATAFAAPAPLFTPLGVDQIVPDKYIVKFKDNSALSALDNASLDKALTGLSANAERHYTGVFKGFAGKLSKETLQRLREHPDVEYIERDSIVSIAAYVTQANAPWNLARISHRARGFTTYVYDDSAGQGACVYIIDTGVAIEHPQFGGRAVVGTNLAGGNPSDGNGHGTAVAGIVGGSIHGVAKKATIVSVKVLGNDGSGSVSNVIAGFDFVARDAATRSCPAGAIINISLGGGFSAALNAAATASVQAGRLVAAAAGNGFTNVAGFSPASAPLVCTVGGSTQADAVLSTSNYGALLDVYAPGQNVVSTWLNGGTQTLSGSSLAAPHVAGLGAYLAALEGVRPDLLCDRIKQLATPNILTGVPSGTNNLLIFNGNPTG